MGFVVLAYGLTYLVLGAYALRLFNRRRQLKRHWQEHES
jgi:hypothetical protein